MSWGARLAALSRAKSPGVDSADSADSPRNRPNGTIDTIGNGGFNGNQPHAMPVQARPNGTIDTIDTIDKEEIRDNRPFVDDPVERAAIRAEAMPVRRIRKRSPAWTPARDAPQPGDWCHCCHGALWWTETEAPKGWRCCACHGPGHLQPGEFRVVAT